MANIYAKLAPYNKFIVALVGAILTVVAQFYGDVSWVQWVILALTAVGVYHAPNAPKA